MARVSTRVLGTLFCNQQPPFNTVDALILPTYPPTYLPDDLLTFLFLVKTFILSRVEKIKLSEIKKYFTNSNNIGNYGYYHVTHCRILEEKIGLQKRQISIIYS